MGRKRVKYQNEKGKGLNLNGVNNYVDITNAAMPVGDFEFSVSVKVKITQTVGYNNIWSYGATNNNKYESVGLFMRDGKFTLEHQNLDATDTVNNFGIGEYIITVTKRFGFINDTLNIYVDGVLQVTTNNVPPTQNFILGNARIYIGRWANIGVPFFNAENFEMYQFHTKELSQIEVTSIASDGVITDNLLRYYDFTDEQGFVLTDKSTFLSNGTLINYTLADVTIGIGNSWTYEDGTPFTNLRSIVIPQLIEYNIGEGLRFNGVSNYVQTNSNNQEFPDNSTDARSYTFFLSSNSNGEQIIYNRKIIISGANAWQYIGCVVDSGFISFYLRRIDNTLSRVAYINWLFSPQVVPFVLNKVYHVCINMNGINVNDWTIYVDNVELLAAPKFSNLLNTDSFSNGTNCFFGQLANAVGTGAGFNGIIYDLKVFNKALSQEEVQEDFDSNGASILASASPNLIAWYPIREQEGFVLKDQSPNALNGTLTNYSLADTTIGIDNKRVDKYGNPITQY